MLCFLGPVHPVFPDVPDSNSSTGPNQVPEFFELAIIGFFLLGFVLGIFICDKLGLNGGFWAILFALVVWPGILICFLWIWKVVDWLASRRHP